jgi:hypothetical protein
MNNSEEIEKIRQEIMRFRELLNIMGQQKESGDQAYARLFVACSPEEIRDVKEKDLQWKVAEAMLGDVSQLSLAVLQMRLAARELESAFEELYDIIVTVQEN